ncbi:vacuolar membrane protein-domain-containing protein [Irpex rosettiformis]|uniref:Vacuolar membrane protein-domain-containing protein n=1 Tax=Irpex rosettiformis TaxID=378272 RepID=A0ACB8U4N3_9APHY|nr:vacuolar membrane protein-domain-containing protein [Irpex rosettiformis]
MDLLGEDDIFDDIPVDHHSCRLLGPTALIVQALMGILVILSLVYKRHKELPKRPWGIWSFDVSKQIIGQMFVHGVNVLISGIVADISSGNACVLYFLNILIDTTFGVAIIYFTLHALTFFLKEKCGLKGFETGKYGSPPSLSFWARQLAVYLFALTMMKLLVLALFAATPGIFKAGEWLLSFLGSSDTAQVIFVMGIFPIIMNILQFWLIDSIVKAGAYNTSVALPSDDIEHGVDPDEEPLFRASTDDEDDETHRHDIEDPRHISRSPSRSRSRDSRAEDESKSSSTGTSPTATASGSGSITPKGTQAIAMHAYPPSLTSTSTSPVSSWNPSTRANSVSPHNNWRRSPPPPLTFQPRSPAPAAVNPAASSILASPPPLDEIHPSNDAHNGKEWAAWEETDDWADRVGEEDWTGNRMAARKVALQDAWTAHTPDTSVRI